MLKAIDIEQELAKLTVLKDRTPETPPELEAQAFATLASMGNGGVFTGSFQGDSPWERHTGDDELVQILKGQTTLTILTDDGPEVLDLQGGMLTVVPQGKWHRFHAPDGVTVLTVTPQPTDHSSAEDPTAEGL